MGRLLYDLCRNSVHTLGVAYWGGHHLFGDQGADKRLCPYFLLSQVPRFNMGKLDFVPARNLAPSVIVAIPYPMCLSFLPI